MFSDGHAKWFRVGWNASNLHTTNVYFPPANQLTTNAIQDGSGPTVTGCVAGNQPAPGGDMCGFGATLFVN